jgi:hypothetical protein
MTYGMCTYRCARTWNVFPVVLRKYCKRKQQWEQVIVKKWFVQIQLVSHMQNFVLGNLLGHDVHGFMSHKSRWAFNLNSYVMYMCLMKYFCIIFLGSSFIQEFDFIVYFKLMNIVLSLAFRFVWKLNVTKCRPWSEINIFCWNVMIFIL